MFGIKRKDQELIYANDQVGCMGKLPIHLEFIKHGITHAEIANLDQWYQSAYHHLSRQYGNAEVKNLFAQMPRYHFIYTAPRNRLPMAGTLISSQDQSGRIYPFVVFRLLENPVAQEFQSIIPLLYQEYYTATKNLCGLSWENYTLPLLFTEINTFNQTAAAISRRGALETTVQTLKSLKLGDYWHGLIQHHPALSLPAFVTASLHAISGLKTRISTTQPGGLRIPIINSGDAHAVIVFWLQLIDAALAGKEYRAQIFWHLGNTQNKPMLLVHFKAMPPSYFEQIINQQRMVAHTIDILHETKNMTGGAVMQSSNDLENSLFDTLGCWSKVIATPGEKP